MRFAKYLTALLTLAVALLALAVRCPAQELEMTWQRFYRSSEDTTTFRTQVTGLVAVPDDGFVVSSFYERYYIGPQAWIFRADRDGEIIWDHRWDSDPFLFTTFSDSPRRLIDMPILGSLG